MSALAHGAQPSGVVVGGGAERKPAVILTAGEAQHAGAPRPQPDWRPAGTVGRGAQLEVWVFAAPESPAPFDAVQHGGDTPVAAHPEGSKFGMGAGHVSPWSYA